MELGTSERRAKKIFAVSVTCMIHVKRLRQQHSSGNKGVASLPMNLPIQPISDPWRFGISYLADTVSIPVGSLEKVYDLVDCSRDFHALIEPKMHGIREISSIDQLSETTGAHEVRSGYKFRPWASTSHYPSGSLSWCMYLPLPASKHSPDSRPWTCRRSSFRPLPCSHSCPRAKRRNISPSPAWPRRPKAMKSQRQQQREPAKPQARREWKP